MAIYDLNGEKIEEKLKWVDFKQGNPDIVESKSLSGRVLRILVPIGFLTTAGVLSTGIYYLFKRNSRKQQIFMRYRVLAQGITLCLAVASITAYKVK